VSAQALHRAENLPENTLQQIRIDARSQNMSRTQANDLIDKIVERASGTIDAENILTIR
jgi:hypothetical protein